LQCADFSGYNVAQANEHTRRAANHKDWARPRFSRDSSQRRQLQTGLPLSSRRTRVSEPFTTSRARMRSASPCLTLEPVRAISSPLLKTHAHVVEKGLGAEIHVGSDLRRLHQQVGNLFLTTFWRQFHFLYGDFHLRLGMDVVFGRA